MADQRKESSLSQASNIAHTAHSAVKIGKAIAAAAKGASVGGPFGAVAGALWGARHHLVKVVAAITFITFLLMLPVFFILMLPSLIFGTGATDPSAEPIMNDNAAIMENINEISFAVSQVLGEGIDDVEARIQQDFAGTGGDNYEIVNPYETNLLYNTNALIAQYLSVVDWVIMDYIKVNPQICGLDYADIYQECCLHLCRAAASYPGAPEKFGAYARKVVRNGLISYCRQVCRQEPALPLLEECLSEDGAPSEGPSHLEQKILDQLIREDLFRALHKAHRQSSGVVRLGIEALEFKAKGMDGREIAALYGVKSNHVGAWISRAALAQLRPPSMARAIPAAQTFQLTVPYGYTSPESAKKPGSSNTNRVFDAKKPSNGSASPSTGSIG